MAFPLAAVPEVWTQIEIFLIGMDPLGSDHQDEMSAQGKIWRIALLGLQHDKDENDSDDGSLDLNPYTYEGRFGDCLSMDPSRYLWTLWGLGTCAGGEELIPDWATGRCSERRVIHIVVGFLGPFQRWQVTRTIGTCIGRGVP